MLQSATVTKYGNEAQCDEGHGTSAPSNSGSPIPDAASIHRVQHNIVRLQRIQIIVLYLQHRHRALDKFVLQSTFGKKSRDP